MSHRVSWTKNNKILSHTISHWNIVLSFMFLYCWTKPPQENSHWTKLHTSTSWKVTWALFTYYGVCIIFIYHLLAENSCQTTKSLKQNIIQVTMCYVLKSVVWSTTAAPTVQRTSCLTIFNCCRAHKTDQSCHEMDGQSIMELKMSHRVSLISLLPSYKQMDKE